jgi:hypothetical protein
MRTKLRSIQAVLKDMKTERMYNELRALEMEGADLDALAARYRAREEKLKIAIKALKKAWRGRNR